MNTQYSKRLQKEILSLDAVLAAILLEAAGRISKRRSIAQLEARLARRFARYFHQQRRLLLAGMAKLRRRPQTAPVAASFGGAVVCRGSRPLREAEPGHGPGLPDLDVVLEELVKTGALDAALTQTVTRILENALEAGADAALKNADVAIQFDLTSPAAVKFVEEEAARLVTGINEVSRKALKGLIVDAVNEGKSYDELAKSIQEMFTEFSDARARMIAVTEIGNAYEEGSLLAARELKLAGLVMEKSWLTAGDDRVDPECEANAEADWIPLEENFPSGHARPLAHPNCRCTMLSRRKPKERETPRPN